jgi:hypothetical protein
MIEIGRLIVRRAFVTGLASWFASPLSRSYEPRSGDCLPRLAPVLNYDPLVATRTAAQ